MFLSYNKSWFSLQKRFSAATRHTFSHSSQRVDGRITSERVVKHGLVQSWWTSTKKKSPCVGLLFGAHLCDNVKQILKNSCTDVAIIPGGMTSLLQPLDTGVNKPFKGIQLHFWWKWHWWKILLDFNWYTAALRLISLMFVHKEHKLTFDLLCKKVSVYCLNISTFVYVVKNKLELLHISCCWFKTSFCWTSSLTSLFLFPWKPIKSLACDLCVDVAYSQ